MYYMRLFILLIPLVGTGTSLLIQLDEETTSTKKQVGQTEVVPPKENINELKKKADEDSSSGLLRNPFSGVVRNGVKKIYHGIETIPIKKIYKGHIITEDSVEDVSDRIDNVETKVEVLSDELHNFEAIAGIYFIVRLFSGLIFTTII